MSSLDANQTAIALACVIDAIASAVDPTGATLRRAHLSLSAGLHMAEEMGVESDASEVVRKLIANLDEMGTARCMTHGAFDGNS